MIQGFFSWRSAILKSALPATTRHVLLTLSCHMNDAGESCYPSIELLSAETGLSRQSVMTHLEKAFDAGWIKIDQHGFKGQKWRRNDYRMAWPNIEGGQRGLPPCDEGGQPGEDKVVKEVDSSTSVNSPKTTDATTKVAAPVEDSPVRYDGERWQVESSVYDGWLVAFQNGRTNRDTEDWIESELAKASLWLQANPRKRKKNYLRFMTNWLCRALDPKRRQGKQPAQATRHAYH